jgi:hypothetical protein
MSKKEAPKNGKMEKILKTTFLKFRKETSRKILTLILTLIVLFIFPLFLTFWSNIKQAKSPEPVMVQGFSWRALGDSNPRPFDS